MPHNAFVCIYHPEICTVLKTCRWLDLSRISSPDVDGNIQIGRLHVPGRSTHQTPTIQSDHRHKKGVGSTSASATSTA